jgi:hypothetical protein
VQNSTISIEEVKAELFFLPPGLQRRKDIRRVLGHLIR